MAALENFSYILTELLKLTGMSVPMHISVFNVEVWATMIQPFAQWKPVQGVAGHTYRRIFILAHFLHIANDTHTPHT